MGKRDLEILAAVTIAFAAFQRGEPHNVELTHEEWERGEELLEAADESFLAGELSAVEADIARVERVS